MRAVVCSDHAVDPRIIWAARATAERLIASSVSVQNQLRSVAITLGILREYGPML